MPEPRLVDPPDWSRLARSRDLRELFGSPDVQQRLSHLTKKLRSQKAGSLETGEINGFLDGVEWVRDLPARQMKAEKDRLDRELEEKTVKASRIMRMRMP